MFRPGSIRKIEVRNFVTYTHAELYPGPHLNMLIGPNGTGKSTMVAAIILGLGGNPKVVGRGMKISEYVKHNCTDASINIFLQGDRENTTVKVTREFDLTEKSIWKLNGTRVVVNQLFECIKKFNIQVDNLCQFLPQDRVQDFAKLNKQDLLRETQKALCRHDLIEKQEVLIQHRDLHRQVSASVDKHVNELQESKEANARLEGRVENFNKKKKYLEQILHINRKIAWLQYDEIQTRLTEVKKDRIKAAEVFEKYKSEAKPVEQEIVKTRKIIDEVQQKNVTSMQAIRNSETIIKRHVEKIDGMKTSIRQIKMDMNSRIDEIQQRSTEIETLIAKLEEMRTCKRNMLAKTEGGAETQQILTAKIQKLSSQFRTMEDRKEEMLQVKQNNMSQLRALENEVNRLENVRQMRLQQLQRTDPDAYSGVLWLRQNKQLFQDEIYEPIMLELNVLDNKNAMFVENVIPMRDRLAFTCVNKEDMNQLIRCMREQKGLTVSVLHSGNTGESLNRFQPDIPIEQLRRYGLYTYMHSLITAPDPIMRYLCKTYRLHNIPIGDNTTNSCYEMIPSQISQFFSDKFRFLISVSKYSKEKSTKQMEVYSDRGLSISVDVIRLENVQGQCREIKKKLATCDGQIETFNTQLEKLTQTINVFRNKLKDINSVKEQVATMDNRIKIMQSKIEDLRTIKINPEVIREDAHKKIKKVVESMSGLQEALRKEFMRLSGLVQTSSLNSIKVENSRRKAAYLENKINDTRQLCREAEETLNRIKDVFANILFEAKSILNKAKALSKGFTPNDEGFEEFKEMFERLPGYIAELRAEEEQIKTRIDCLNTADDAELQEYEDRLQRIENLQASIEKGNNDLTSINSKIGCLEQGWLVPLNELLTQINYKFGSAFERMGCAGEISLCTGDNNTDYSQYGISIKVTYRNGEPLQELNTIVQSGGERAVATAVFMLSLQELTPVPFRCVDEINQGMDANNERRIFELVVDSTSEPDTSQYFLITPKLVPNLKFSRSVMIHIVHNGPFVVPDRKWSFSNICNPQAVRM